MAVVPYQKRGASWFVPQTTTTTKPLAIMFRGDTYRSYISDTQVQHGFSTSSSSFVVDVVLVAADVQPLVGMRCDTKGFFRPDFMVHTMMIMMMMMIVRSRRGKVKGYHVGRSYGGRRIQMTNVRGTERRVPNVASSRQARSWLSVCMHMEHIPVHMMYQQMFLSVSSYI